MVPRKYQENINQMHKEQQPEINLNIDRDIKEIETEKIEYESSDVILGRIVELESEICIAFDELRQKLM